MKSDYQLLKRFIAKRYDIRDTYFNIDEAKLLYHIFEKKLDPFDNTSFEKMD